jgi:hypothetical protein
MRRVCNENVSCTEGNSSTSKSAFEAGHKLEWINGDHGDHVTSQLSVTMPTGNCTLNLASNIDENLLAASNGGWEVAQGIM